MRYFIFTFFLISLFLPSTSQAVEADLATKLSGRILLQVESYGRAWYVEPVEQTRYYLKDGETAYQLMREKSLGISNKDLAKIRISAGQSYDAKLTERLKGRILLQVEAKGEAWYVNPVDGLRYYLRDGEAAYNLMREFSLGVSNADLAKIPMSHDQVVADYAFDGVTSALLVNGEYQIGSQADLILPIASLTKLMTALVVLDHNPDWEQYLTITEEQIDYPKYYVGEDVSSEVDIEAGQRIKIKDLWVAMLLASSNQAAVALADATGLSRSEFAEAMNAKAEDLGLTKTLFFEMTGLDSHNVSTAKEMAMIARAAFSHPEIADNSVMASYQMPVQNSDNSWSEVPVVNRNYSLLAFLPDGAKTGFLVEAQRTVVLKKDDKIICILHARSMNERNSLIENLLTKSN